MSVGRIGLRFAIFQSIADLLQWQLLWLLTAFSQLDLVPKQQKISTFKWILANGEPQIQGKIDSKVSNFDNILPCSSGVPTISTYLLDLG